MHIDSAFPIPLCWPERDGTHPLFAENGSVNLF